MRNGLSGFSFDSDPVYYGGYMVANGWWPFIDWGSSYSVLPALIEGAFMQVLGTGWHVTVVHAGLTNGIYALLAFTLFRHFGLNCWIALSYAAAAAVTYYAPIGYGSPDKPSFVYLMAALLLQAKAFEADHPAKVAILYVGVALAAIASLMAKLNPSVLYILPMLAMFLGLNGAGRWAGMFAGLGVVAALGAVTILIELLHPGFVANLVYYAIKLPLIAGSDRMGAEGSFAYTKLASYTNFAAFNLLYGLMLAGLGALWLRRTALLEPQGYRRVTLPVLLGFSFCFVTVFHLSHIAQPWPAHVTLVVPGLALLHAALANSIQAGGGGQSQSSATWLLAVVLVATVLLDAKEYQRVVGKPRLIFDYTVELGETEKAGSLGFAAFKYVRWIPYPAFPGLDEELRDVVAAMDSVAGNVFVLGLPNHYYVFTGKAPLLPAMLVLAGHTTPPVGTEQEARIIEGFSRNVALAKVRHVVTNREQAEGPAKAFLASRWVCKVTDVGKRAVLAELCGSPEPDYQRLAPILYGFIPRQDTVPQLD
jgi:hypothetical protein